MIKRMTRLWHSEDSCAIISSLFGVYMDLIINNNKSDPKKNHVATSKVKLLPLEMQSQRLAEHFLGSLISIRLSWGVRCCKINFYIVHMIYYVWKDSFHYENDFITTKIFQLVLVFAFVIQRIDLLKPKLPKV